MTQRRVLKAIGWGIGAGLTTLVTMIVAGTMWAESPMAQNRRAEEFIDDAITTMRRSGDPMQVPEAYTRKFADGSTVAIYMGHASCSGNGFNATVIYDSRGHITVNKTRDFCGYEEMDGVMDSVPAASLDQFYANLRDLPLTNR